MKEVISCMGIVISKSPNSSCKVLIMENDGEFVFPKGHLEPMETEIECAIREVLEETEVLVSSSEYSGSIDEFRFYFKGEDAIKVIKVHLFIKSDAPLPNPNSDEGISKAYWIDCDMALVKISHEDARNAFRKALDQI